MVSCWVGFMVMVWAGHLNVVRETSARHMLAERSISRQWSEKREGDQYFLVASYQGGRGEH